MDRVGEGVAFLQLTHLQVPHEEIHGLAVAERLEPLLVIGRMPRLEDVGVPLIALDQEAALVVGGEVHRADQPLPAPLPNPPLGGPEQRLEDVRVVLRVDEAELPVASALELVPATVDLGRDPPDRLSVPPGQEVLGLGVLEVGVLLLVQELAPLQEQRRNPRGAFVEPKRQLDELAQLAAALYGPYLDRHPRKATSSASSSASPSATACWAFRRTE